MKKAFLNIVLILMAAFIASAFLSGFYAQDDVVKEAALAVRSSMNIILISCTLSWVLGSVLGILLGFSHSALKNTLLYIFETVLNIPAFLMTAIIILLFGNSMWTVILATMLPVFFMTAGIAAKSASYFKNAAFADFMPQLGSLAFWKHYVFPLLAAPIATAFLRAFRVLLYIDLSLGILGIMPSYTLGGIISQIADSAAASPSMLALAISVLLILLINIACLLANSLLAPLGKAKTDFSFKKIRR